jgi:hypothetical protein
LNFRILDAKIQKKVRRKKEEERIFHSPFTKNYSTFGETKGKNTQARAWNLI